MPVSSPCWSRLAPISSAMRSTVGASRSAASLFHGSLVASAIWHPQIAARASQVRAVGSNCPWCRYTCSGYLAHLLCTNRDRIFLVLLAGAVRVWKQALLLVQEDDSAAFAIEKHFVYLGNTSQRPVLHNRGYLQRLLP